MLARVHSPFIVGMLLLVILIASWPLLTPGLFEMHDFIHGARIVELARGIQDGHFPVIWSQNFGYGYGMPLFEFYAPLPFYVGAIFYLLGLGLITSVKLLFFLATLGSVLGSYYFGKALSNRWGGLAVAALVGLAPYRALNLYIRGAVSESWGMVFGILTLLFVYRVAKGELKSWLWLSLSVAGLVLSHNLSVLIFLPVAAGLGAATLVNRALSSSWQAQLVPAVVLAAATVGGMLVTASYSVPMFLEKELTQVESSITGEYFDYHIHYLYPKQFFTEYWGYGGSGYGPDDSVSFFLGYALLAAAILGCAAVVQRTRQLWSAHSKLNVLKRLSAVFKSQFLTLSVGLLVVGSFGMTLYWANPVWEALPLLKFMQFPWRFLSVAVVLLAVWFVAALNQLKSQLVQNTVFIGLVLLSIWNGRYFVPQAYLADSSTYFYAEPARIAREMSPVLPDYIPLTFDQTLPVATTPIVAEPGIDVEAISVLENKTQRVVVTTNFAAEKTITFARAAFPGWQFTIDGQAVNAAENAAGLLAVNVSAGTHTVQLELGRTPVRQKANWTSLAAVLVILVAVVWQRKKYG